MMARREKQDGPDHVVEWDAVRAAVEARGPLAGVLVPGPTAAVQQIHALFNEYESRRGPADPDSSRIRQWMIDMVLAEYATEAPGLPHGKE